MPSHAISGSAADFETARAASDHQPSPQADETVAAPGHWRDHALCAHADPDLWSPEPGESAHTAKVLCGWCPVREQCLAWALDTKEPYGICGGLTPLERHSLAIRRAAEDESTGQVA
jgi:WhiB family redox-sensing transcriptional regulator